MALGKSGEKERKILLNYGFSVMAIGKSEGGGGGSRIKLFN